MKIRQGFVSNSSSTSFYIDASKHSMSKVKKAIKTILGLLDVKDNDISSICTTYETEDTKALEMEIRQYDAPFDSLFIDPKNFREIKFPKKVIVVDSITDNSIPWEIQEFLESHFDATRQHWG
jgi:hypothetical protein